MILPASTWQGALTASVRPGPPAPVTALMKEGWSATGRCGLWKKTGVPSVPARWGWCGAVETVTVLSFPLCSPSPSVSTQLLIHRSPMVPEKDSVLIPTTANDDAGWQADLLGMRWGVGVAKRLLNTGGAEQRSQWVPLLRAGSAFKVGWVRALMSRHLLLLQSCWLNLLFPWNDHLHELPHSSGDIIQKSKAQRLVVARDRWTSDTLLTQDDDSTRLSGKWSLFVVLGAG